MLSASANKLSRLKEQAEEYAALIMEELDPERLGYIEVSSLLLHFFNGATFHYYFSTIFKFYKLLVFQYCVQLFHNYKIQVNDLLNKKKKKKKKNKNYKIF